MDRIGGGMAVSGVICCDFDFEKLYVYPLSAFSSTLSLELHGYCSFRIQARSDGKFGKILVMGRNDGIVYIPRVFRNDLLKMNLSDAQLLQSIVRGSP